MASGPAPSASIKPATAFSCVRCFDRKVKCDRLQPCNACQKHSAECVYRVPPPPRRRKKRAQEEILHDRLRRYERLLQEKGIDPHDATNLAPRAPQDDRDGLGVSEPGSETASSPSHVGEPADRKFVSSQLVFDQGRSQYIDNHLWSRVAEEDALLAPSDEDEEDSSDSLEDGSPDLLFAPMPSNRGMRTPHPPPDHILSLWHIFLENINPLNKIIHRPTLHVSIQQAVSDSTSMSKSLEALMFAIYSGAIYSLKEQECEYQFGEKRQVLLSRFRRAAKTALTRAKFPSTKDILVLQAFLLHLVSSRDAYDPRTFWVLTGAAVRVAEGMGLHRDGTRLGLPPFESEIRRRIWWQVMMLDSQSAELAGSSKFRHVIQDPDLPDVPLNLNDDDIYPGMEALPKPRNTSEMMFCCLRYNFGSFWFRKIIEQRACTHHDTSIWGNFDSIDDIADKDKNIDELQRNVGERFLKHCDQSEPAQLLAFLVASYAPLAMRLVVHHPRRYVRDQDVPASERDLLWSCSTRLIEVDNDIHTNRKLAGFLWHSAFHFQWQALIYVLDILRAQPLKTDADKAWRLVHECYENHPAFVTDIKRPVHVAVGTLCLNAYTVREKALANQGIAIPLRPPEYITKLRQQREALPNKKRNVRAVSSSTQSRTDDSVNTESMRSYDFSEMARVPPLQQQQQPLSQSQQQPQSSTQYQQIFTQPSMMDTNMAWYDGFGFQPADKNKHTNGTGLDADHINAVGTNTSTNGEYFMDWNQWDMLLQNHSMDE